MMTQDKEFYNVQEAAHFLGVSAEYVRRLTRRGKLPHSRVGSIILIKREDLMALPRPAKGEEDNDV